MYSLLLQHSWHEAEPLEQLQWEGQPHPHPQSNAMVKGPRLSHWAVLTPPPLVDIPQETEEVDGSCPSLQHGESPVSGVGWGRGLL